MSVKAIIGYLGVPRRSLQSFLQRWIVDGVQSLPGKKSGRPPGSQKVTLPIIAAIKEKQETSAIGKFRMAAFLKQQFGVEVSPASCGRFMAKNRHLYALLARPQKVPPPKKLMPFKATYPHQYWSVDICSIEHHRLPDHDGPFYIITVLDNYSRKIVASAPSRTQDLWAFLLVFCTALYVYGAPAGLVSDGGSVFTAHASVALYQRLAIRKEQIEAGKPWQDYVETHFAVMKRMELYALERATTWEEVCATHARFVVDYNNQEHFAHQDRSDGRHTPSEVMGWVRGQPVEAPTLRELFDLIYGTRKINRVGYIRYANWRIYSDEQLAGQKASVWVMKETHTLTIVHEEAALAEYGVLFAADGRHFDEMRESRTFPSPAHPPPPRLWDERVMDAIEWRKVYRARQYAPRRRRKLGTSFIQEPLFA